MFGWGKKEGNEEKMVVPQQEDEYTNENCVVDFQFADMNKDKKKVVILDKYDPANEHRTVYPGLNFQAVCWNQNCKVFENRVWVKRGYGEFHVGTEIHELKCPICSSQLQSETVKTLGYTRSLVTVQGKKAGEKNKMSWTDKQTEGKLVKFDGYNGDTCKWSFLKIRVQKA